MNIQQITVTAGRTFNNPYESYSNLRPEVVMTATLEPGEDSDAAVKSLQAQAEGLVEDHKNHLLRNLEELHQLSQEQTELRNLQTELTRAQNRMDEIRARHPSLIAIEEQKS